MDAISYSSPRFSQEIFDLILFEALSYYLPRWPDASASLPPDYPLLNKCALVSKAWNASVMKYRWATVAIHPQHTETNAKLLSCLSERPWLRKYIQHVEFFDIGNEADFHALCLFLAPVMSVKITDQSDKDLLGAFAFAPAHHVDDPLSRSISSFLHPTTLTALSFQGTTFYTGLLENTPNLRDLSISGLWSHECYIGGRPFENLLQPLSFRLRRAIFKNATDVISSLLDAAPLVFSELEELEIGDSLERFPENRGEAYVAEVLTLAKDTIRRVVLGQGTPCKLIRGIDTDRIQSFKVLTSFSMTVTAHLFEEEEEDAWNQITNFLDSKPTLFQSLQNFELVIKGISFYSFKELAEWDSSPGRLHPGWKAMKTSLVPDRIPVLRRLCLRASWCYTEPYDVSGNADSCDIVSKQMEKVFLLHFPVFEGDTRKIDQSCKLVPDYT